MTTKAEINAMVDRALQDDAGKLTSDEIDGFMTTEALQMYTRHRPYTAVVDLSANGTYSYEISASAFPSWVDGFSYIAKIRYPAGEYQDPRDEEIAFEDWEIYETTTTKYLRFTSISPTSGKTIRVFHTAVHTIPASTAVSIYANDIGAFVNLTSSFCAAAIARGYGQTSNSTIGADAIAYRDKSDIWASRAKELYTKYIEYMFPDQLDASMAFREFDTKFEELGFSRLTHKAWTR